MAALRLGTLSAGRWCTLPLPRVAGDEEEEQQQRGERLASPTSAGPRSEAKVTMPPTASPTAASRIGSPASAVCQCHAFRWRRGANADANLCVSRFRVLRPDLLYHAAVVVVGGGKPAETGFASFRCCELAVYDVLGYDSVRPRRAQPRSAGTL